ncbi:MAG: hypothetical protein IPM20_05140 [Gammaproteobacteria bacterium]|nr:hypothetical protein [Gammaproteobacteria bacterium]
MSSSGYAAPLRLDLRPSRRLACYLLAVHGGALACLPALPLGAMTGGLLAVLILLCLARNYTSRVLMRGGHDVVALVWTREGDWRLIERGGRERVCHLRADSYVHPALTVLNFSGECRRSIVLLADSLEGEVHRRLRVRLGLRGQGAPEQGYPA